MNAIPKRLHRLFVRWGLLKHPYGREYAKQRYTVFGGIDGDADE